MPMLLFSNHRIVTSPLPSLLFSHLRYWHMPPPPSPHTHAHPSLSFCVSRLKSLRLLVFQVTMIYDTNSPLYQQFLRSSGRRRDDYQKAKTSISNVKAVHKPAGAASTGL